MDQVRSTDGVVLALHDLGGDGEPLLLVHATMFCGRVWEPVAAHLGRFHCFAPDLRAHGRSPLPASGAPLDWPAIATDVLATVDHLGVERPRAVGHSMGAACLLLAELARPGTFDALWLYDPVVRPSPAVIGPSETTLAAGARRRRATFPSRDAAYHNFSAKPPLDRAVPAARRAYVDHAFEALPDGSVTLCCRPEVEAEIYELGALHGAYDRLGEVGCPVTVAHGFPEEGRPSTWAPDIAARLPAGREVAFAHLSHFGPLEEPATVAAAVLEAFPPR
jgi:pimeloyl-ACP methyl ester carboxylesterase